MTLAVGASHFFGLAQSGAWDSVSGVGSFNYIPGHPSGLKQVKGLVYSKMARSMNDRFGRYGHKMVDGTITGDWYYEGWGKLLKNALSLSTQADTPVSGTKTHTFTIPDATGAFSNEYGLVIYDHKDLKTWRNLSCFAKSLSWNWAEGPFVTFSAGIVGASRTLESAATPSFGTLAPATPFGNGSTTGLVVTAVVNGNTYSNVYCKQMSLTLNVPVDLMKSINSQTPIKPVRNGRFTVEGSWTWAYSSNDALSADWLSDWDSEETADLRIKMTSVDYITGTTPYSTQFDINDLYIKGDDPVVAGPGEIEQTFSFSGGVETMATSPASSLIITLINNETL